MTDDRDAHEQPAEEPEHPGKLLRRQVLSGLRLSVTQAAEDLRVTRQTLHRILRGSAPITPFMAARLERFCGIPARFWLDKQNELDLRRIERDAADALRGVRPHRLPSHAFSEIGCHIER